MTAFEPEAVDVLVETNEKKVAAPRRRGELPIQISLFAIGALVALPIVVALFTSVTSLSEILRDPNSVWSPPWTFDNFVTAWTATPFGRFMVNSFIQTGLITIAQVLFSILAAYAFAMFRFPGRNLMFAVVLGSLMVPFELTFIPNFVLISNLGWANTYQGLVIPFLASAFGVFMLRQFFMALPRDLYDAAKIDGATDWYYLWKVVVPLSKGAIAALTIFSFLGAWNQYLWPLVITNEESMRTAQIGIRFFLVNQERATDWGAIMAGATIVMLPTLLVFLVAQKQLVKGIAMSGLKG
ncbi:MAG TPA: carbohydrate ABC transporter permease [Acidimicrobiia bacterium]|jgi:ABC-type glycerol-3-phosphate transport system permease component|nr:carbohydrate ABC transporter permease [Acidimicrobiia bacterium]